MATFYTVWFVYNEHISAGKWNGSSILRKIQADKANIMENDVQQVSDIKRTINIKTENTPQISPNKCNAYSGF